FGRVSGEHEPERDGFQPAIAESVERVAERVAWSASLELVFAPTAKPVMLLGDVDELEVEREGTDHGLLFPKLESTDRLAEPIARGTLARLPREQANAFFGIEQLRAALLDHHAAEHVAEEPDVPPEPGVGGVGAHAHILPRKSEGAAPRSAARSMVGSA